MAFFAFLLGDGQPLVPFEDSPSLSGSCFIAALVAGLVSLCWYLAIRYHTKRNRRPQYPAPFLYLAGSSVGLFLLGFIGGIL